MKLAGAGVGICVAAAAYGGAASAEGIAASKLSAKELLICSAMTDTAKRLHTQSALMGAVASSLNGVSARLPQEPMTIMEIEEARRMKALSGVLTDRADTLEMMMTESGKQAALLDKLTEAYCPG